MVNLLFCHPFHHCHRPFAARNPRVVVEMTVVAVLILPVSLPYSCSKKNDGACPVCGPSRGVRPEKTTSAFATICGDV